MEFCRQSNEFVFLCFAFEIKSSQRFLKLIVITLSENDYPLLASKCTHNLSLHAKY